MMKPSRLHPLALVLMIGGSLIKYSPVFIFGFWRDFAHGTLNQEDVLSTAALLAIVAGLIALASLVRYWRFRYTLGTSGITIESGLWRKQSTHIPYANIQTLQRQQWFFLQPFGLERLSIETAGKADKKAEATLAAVPTRVAVAIEAHRHPDQPVTPTAADAPDHTYTADAHALNLYALTSLGVIPIITGLLWLVNKADDLAPKAWVASVEATLAHLALALTLGLAVLVLVLGMGLSYLNLWQKYYRFTLTATGETLTTTRGLLARNTVSVRTQRIQAVRAKASILRQWCHLTTVQGLTASRAADDESDDDLVLMPVVTTAKVLATMQPFIAWLPATMPPLTRPVATTRWRFARNAAMGYAIVAGLALVASWLWWPPGRLWVTGGAGLLLVLGTAQGAYAARQTGVAVLDTNRIVAQSGHWFAQETFFIRRATVQTVSRAQSLWMAPLGLTHLTLNLRKGNGNEAVTLKYLNAATVTAVMTWFQPHDSH
ncbi:PH domain-containing protein [Lacticaseibacillus daqingensis]|uniref:PH domain-containing protein n=1 Tax=Lacticaseibacillus daqingensis TaxID=2486014 RepID=UPI000F7866E5|nr:PH domain-containing protein [Lacticaseibacillus daqingensis]